MRQSKAFQTNYNFWGNENFHNIYERLLHERQRKIGYLKRHRIYERPLHLRVNLFLRIKANIFQSYLYINSLQNVSLFTAISKTSLKNKSSMLKKCLFKRISSILIPKSSAKSTRKTNSKRGNLDIFFSPLDEILCINQFQRCPPPPPSPGQPRGICSRCQSRGWGIRNFIAAPGAGH